MTLTLADLDRWGPTPSIVCSRPRSTAPTGVRSTATQIGDVMAPTLWEGDSHDAAMGATGRIQDDLLNHAEECEAVGRAARAAEAEVCDIQRDWHDVHRMADHRGIAINTETGELSYIPPPDPSDRAEMERRVDIIENEIRALLTRAEQADDDLAAAIRVAAGQESVADLNQQLPTIPRSRWTSNRATTTPKSSWSTER